MVDKSLHFQLHDGDHKSSGQITNGLVDGGVETGPFGRFARDLGSNQRQPTHLFSATASKYDLALQGLAN
eukprot:6212647-Pleurochrysis_carterae.AAC.5